MITHVLYTHFICDYVSPSIDRGCVAALRVEANPKHVSWASYSSTVRGAAEAMGWTFDKESNAARCPTCAAMLRVGLDPMSIDDEETYMADDALPEPVRLTDGTVVPLENGLQLLVRGYQSAELRLV